MSTILGNPLSIGGGGAKIGVTLNEDGTQNLFLTDNNTVLNLLTGTEDATATPADVASGKTFYAQGQKKMGTAVSYEPVLLWSQAYTNGMSWGAQTISLNNGFNAYLVELSFGLYNSEVYSSKKAIDYLEFGTWADSFHSYKALCAADISSGSNRVSNSRVVLSCKDGEIQFGRGLKGSKNSYDDHCAIPTRIWGVKFTLN